MHSTSLTESLISFTITSITNHGEQILGFTVAKKAEWERKWKEKKKFLASVCLQESCFLLENEFRGK